MTVVLERADGEAFDPALAAEFVLGLRLRAYEWDKHKTKKKDEPPPVPKITVQVEEHGRAKKLWADLQEVAAGVELARDLVNEARTCWVRRVRGRGGKLTAVGVEVEILSDKDMKKLGMGALLGVAQGSVRPARLAIMRWNGAKAKEQPIAFVGKGVCSTPAASRSSRARAWRT